ncbi:MAG: bifunctional riboflavin kinase/FAD synthetase [Clostridia bacterium]|nr:bifunctional riboflavin kinase/FAD synthetase [Clostridia bacterium]
MIKEPCAVALGFFDGVHIAHQKIISHAVSYAKENNLLPVALSFKRSPMELLSQNKVRYITSLEDKRYLMEKLGARAEFLPVSKEFLDMPPEEFITEILVKKYNIKYAVCGYNYHFGKGGKGDTKMLIQFGKELGFCVEVVDCEVHSGESVSSSRIRELISNGKIKEANELLGRNFFVRGTVSEGKKLGRKLGFPTANVFLQDLTLIPKNGVYKTLVSVDSKSYIAITNTGINPTVGGEKLRTETFIPGFCEDIYNKEIKIEFIDFIREEIKFESIDDLKSQIQKDIKNL